MESDWRVKWTKVNRAAGVVCGMALAAPYSESAPPPAHAQALIDRVAQELNLSPEEKATMVKGLAKRVALGLVEWGADSEEAVNGIYQAMKDAPERCE